MESVERLVQLVLSLNPKCNEIGSGMLAQMQHLALEINTSYTAQNARDSTIDSLSEKHVTPSI